MTSKLISRREFLYASGVLMLGGSVLTGCQPKESNTIKPPLAAGPINITPQNKILVFIMLGGGNDSFNMLIPTDDASYQDYKTTRGSLALDKSTLMNLDSFTDSNNKSFGLHPSLKKLSQRFNDQELAFIANVGPLITPITKQEFVAGNKPLPIGLMSHSDQFKHWQTSQPHLRSNKGWFGSIADVLENEKDKNSIPMNISLAGSNIMQNGNFSREYAITEKGSIGLKIKDNNKPELSALNKILLDSFDLMLNKTHQNSFAATYIETTKYAQQQHEKFYQAINKININTDFSSADKTESPLASQLKMVAKTIAASSELGLQQQTFFLRYIGWDHHSELLNQHKSMLTVLDDALDAFQKSLHELNIEDKVVTFTGSDFGRSLTSNGNGTDHGWGGTPWSWGKQSMGEKSLANIQN